MTTEQGRDFPYGYRAQAKKALRAGMRDSAGESTLPDGTVVTDPKALAYLNALIELDVDAAEKIGPGIERWEIYSNQDLHPPKNSTGYRIIRVDGSGPVTFGYGDVLDPPKLQTLVQRTLSDEAADLMLAFRKDSLKHGPVTCAKSGREINSLEESQAKHVNPKLSQLHAEFLASEGLDYLDIEFVNKKDDGRGYKLVDRALAARWHAYQESRIGGLELRYLRRNDRPLSGDQ